MNDDWEDASDTSRKSNSDSVKQAHAAIADSMRDARQRIADSTKTARAHNMDSVREAHAHIADSLTHARKEKSDSIQAVRKHFTDSTAAIHKYRDSKHYKDSVARSRTAKTKALTMARQSKMDSLKEARKQITDSLTALRKERTDSIKTIQKRRSDSLAVIKKYKTSKRYADSVSIVRHDRMDSIKTSQKHFRDSIAAVRKHTLDSSKLVRQHITDSTKTARLKYVDSIKLVRKAKTDSLAKVKADKEKLAKAKEKKKEDALKIKLELKMKEKHEKWSNKSMLKKKWSPMRRALQNSFTHYNYYYNSNKKMEEALENMQRSRKENYDSLIGLYPFDPNRDSSMIARDMDSIVRKISVAIQIHDPRVKWSNDLYLLLGEAYYYKGSYDNAAIAFRYIISKDAADKKKEAAKNGYGYNKTKEAPSILEEENKSKLDFLKHKSVHNEAILWLARTYTESKHVDNTESVLSLLESDAKLPDNLKGRLATEKAFAHLAERNDLEAADQLAVSINDNNLPNWLRLREAFLNGQILQNEGRYTDAASSFEKVLTYFPKIEMDFYSRKYIAYNRLLAGENIDEAITPLKRMLNDGKYVSYYDQVYFVLGQLATKAHETRDAIKYLTKSTTTPKATKKQKALSFAMLGDVYYSSSQYPDAQRAYDSAIKYSSAAPKDSAIIVATQRSKGLKEVSGPTAVIHDQDSLLALARLSKKEQVSAVRAYLRELEQRQEDSIENAQNSGVTTLTPVDQDNDNADANGWYFSNPALVQQGVSDFQKKWGTRPLTDNWRRAASITVAANSGQDDGSSGGANSDNGLPTEESLLAKIPNQPQQKELCIKLEQRAYILLAKAYYRQLEDYKMANNTLDTLDIRYPDNNQKEEELYLRYEIALKQNDLDKAQKYSEELISKYPQSQYASTLRPKQNDSKHAVNDKLQPENTYYDETYNMVLDHQYTPALERIKIAQQQYDNPAYKKRFELIEAMCYAGMNQFTAADSMIGKFMRTYPSDTLIAWASTVKQYISEVRSGGMPSWYKDWPPKEEVVAGLNKKPVKKKQAPPPDVKPPPPPVPAAYAYHTDSAHYCIIILPGLDSKTVALKKGIKEFDSSNYAAAGLSTLLDMYNTTQIVLVIQKFPNADSAKSYMDGLLASPLLQGYNPGEVKTFIISASNYRKMFADKTALPYSSFYSSFYKS